MTAGGGGRRRRWTGVCGWTLIAAGVAASWIWSLRLSTPGAWAEAAAAGAATFVLIGAGVALLARRSRRGSRRARVGRTAVVVLFVIAAAAGVVPAAVVAATTGTVAVTATVEQSTPGIRLSAPVTVTSDEYALTRVEATVHADDRWAPRLHSTVTFDDGSTMTCASTRAIRVHGTATVTLHCDGFAPVAALRTIASLTIAER